MIMALVPVSAQKAGCRNEQGHNLAPTSWYFTGRGGARKPSRKVHSFASTLEATVPVTLLFPPTASLPYPSSTTITNHCGTKSTTVPIKTTGRSSQFDRGSTLASTPALRRDDLVLGSSSQDDGVEDLVVPKGKDRSWLLSIALVATSVATSEESGAVVSSDVTSLASGDVETILHGSGNLLGELHTEGGLHREDALNATSSSERVRSADGLALLLLDRDSAALIATVRAVNDVGDLDGPGLAWLLAVGNEAVTLSVGLALHGSQSLALDLCGGLLRHCGHWELPWWSGKPGDSSTTIRVDGNAWTISTEVRLDAGCVVHESCIDSARTAWRAALVASEQQLERAERRVNNLQVEWSFFWKKARVAAVVSWTGIDGLLASVDANTTGLVVAVHLGVKANICDEDLAIDVGRAAGRALSPLHEGVGRIDWACKGSAEHGSCKGDCSWSHG